MDTIVFDGEKVAREREMKLRTVVREMRHKPRILSIVFDEDPASQLYTRLKFEAASRVGIEFDRQDHSLLCEIPHLQQQIVAACAREDVTGVMIQKPSKRAWQEVTADVDPDDFSVWWQMLTSQIKPHKDVDCLTKVNLEHVYVGDWRRLPATVKAVLSILEIALELSAGELVLSGKASIRPLEGKRVTVLGRSEIVGRPLAAVMRHKGAQVDIGTSQTLDLGELTTRADVLVSATGRRHIVKEDLVKPGAIVIDVGSPVEEVDFEWVRETAAFITPVPNGVGPMTVVSLLENAVELVVGKKYAW
jgi:methylenetetrahydrofolate dehydrogenase (NADP+) / methenyltetrahydrofolate cyclohydrolase